MPPPMLRRAAPSGSGSPAPSSRAGRRPRARRRPPRRASSRRPRRRTARCRPGPCASGRSAGPPARMRPRRRTPAWCRSRSPRFRAAPRSRAARGEVALGHRDGRQVVEGEGDAGHVAGGVEVAEGVRDVLLGLGGVALPEQPGAQHVQRPGLHRPVAGPAEDLERLAELGDPLARAVRGSSGSCPGPRPRSPRRRRCRPCGRARGPSSSMPDADPVRVGVLRPNRRDRSAARRRTTRCSRRWRSRPRRRSTRQISSASR